MYSFKQHLSFNQHGMYQKHLFGDLCLFKNSNFLFDNKVDIQNILVFCVFLTEELKISTELTKIDYENYLKCHDYSKTKRNQRAFGCERENHISTFHVKLGLMKQSVKVLNRGFCFDYLARKFPGTYTRHLKAGIVNVPQIRELIKDSQFTNQGTR